MHECTRSIAPLIEAYRAKISARWRAKKNIADRMRALHRVIEFAGINTLDEFTEKRIVDALAALGDVVSRSSLHHFARAVKSFSRWLHLTGRSPLHVLADHRWRTGRRPRIRRDLPPLPPSVQQHVSDFREFIASRDVCPKHVHDTIRRLETVLGVAGVANVQDDLKLERVSIALKQLLTDGLSRSSVNHHAQVVKYFVRFLWLAGRLESHRLQGLRALNEQIAPRHKRRAWSPAECATLLSSVRARSAIVRGGMTAAARAMFYELAMLSGLRSNEIRSLTAGDVQEFDGAVFVHLRPEFAKNRQETFQPLPAAFGARLLSFAQLAMVGARARRMYDDAAKERQKRKPASSVPENLPEQKHEDARDAVGKAVGVSGKLFKLPSKPQIVRMLRADQKRAGMKYRSPDGVADFHSLRTTFITNISLVAPDPETLRVCGRLSSASIAQRYYTRRTRPQIVAAINQLESTGGIHA